MRRQRTAALPSCSPSSGSSPSAPVPASRSSPRRAPDSPALGLPPLVPAYLDPASAGEGTQPEKEWEKGAEKTPSEPSRNTLAPLALAGEEVDPDHLLRRCGSAGTALPPHCTDPPRPR